jgi:hypothetical protein
MPWGLFETLTVIMTENRCFPHTPNRGRIGLQNRGIMRTEYPIGLMDIRIPWGSGFRHPPKIPFEYRKALSLVRASLVTCPNRGLVNYPEIVHSMLRRRNPLLADIVNRVGNSCSSPDPLHGDVESKNVAASLADYLLVWPRGLTMPPSDQTILPDCYGYRNENC